MMRAHRRKADFEHVAPAAPGVERGPAAAGAMGVDQLADRRVDPGLLQGLDHEAALPGAIGTVGPMLGRAAAADAEMRADRRDALGARLEHRKQVTPVRMARDRLGLHPLTRQRVGHEHRPGWAGCDAVAAVTETGDGELFGHVVPDCQTVLLTSGR